MIECIVYLAAAQRQLMYINPRSIQTLRDVPAPQVGVPSDDPDETICETALVDFQGPIYLCHDAEQVAQAMVRSLANNTVTRPEDT